MTYVITDACVDITDRSCLRECPVDCIQQGVRMLYINPDECIDCGACEPVCPQDAIHPDYGVPEDRIDFVSINAEFFTADTFGPADPGSGRGSGVDHPAVAARPHS